MSPAATENADDVDREIAMMQTPEDQRNRSPGITPVVVLPGTPQTSEEREVEHRGGEEPGRERRESVLERRMSRDEILEGAAEAEMFNASIVQPIPSLDGFVETVDEVPVEAGVSSGGAFNRGWKQADEDMDEVKVIKVEPEDTTHAAGGWNRLPSSESKSTGLSKHLTAGQNATAVSR
eukprot:2201804-Rhodomonas_salina.1